MLDSPASAANAVRARISHCPDEAEGWVELLASGLTFDLAGLEPAASAALPPPGQRFALSGWDAGAPVEALSLAPGPHVSAGGALLPVVRVICGLASRLATELCARAVCWQPAGTWMACAYFDRIVAAWLAGGAFPALGLAAMAPGPDGTVTTQGLVFFTGQELTVPARPGEGPADTVKLAVRIADLLVGRGPLAGREELAGPDGEQLVLEPGAGGTTVMVRRPA